MNHQSKKTHCPQGHAYGPCSVRKRGGRRCMVCHNQERFRYPIKGMLGQARSRSRRFGRQFDLTDDDIRIPMHCPILGLKLGPVGGGQNGRNDNSPSLDRIDSSLGYVRGNVWVISNRANMLKRDATLAELRALTAGVARRLFLKSAHDWYARKAA